MQLSEVSGDESKLDMTMAEVDMNTEHTDMLLTEQQKSDKQLMELQGGEIVMNTDHTDKETSKKRLDSSKI